MSLEKVNPFHDSSIIGGFLLRSEILEDSISRSMLISMVNGLLGESPYAFHNRVPIHLSKIGELLTCVLASFDVVFEIFSHALVDAHASPFTFDSPIPITRFEASSLFPLSYLHH